MGKIIVSTVSVLIFSFTSPSAMAQLSDLLKGIKNAVEGGSVVPLDPVAKPAPSPKPAAQVTSKPVEQPPVKSAAEKKLELEWPESEYLFACNIKGKTFAISKHFDSDDPNIRISYGKRDAKTQLSELDFRSTSKVPLLITEQFGERKSVTSVYFVLKDITYGMSKCDGMLCSPDETYWLASYKGGKLISHESCDETPMIDWNMPVLTDKTGKIRTNPSMKDVLQVRPSKLNFHLFK